jgi:hypothetical protein
MATATEHTPISFKSKMNYEEYNYYVVIIYDGGYISGLDLRGV